MKIVVFASDWLFFWFFFILGIVHCLCHLRLPLKKKKESEIDTHVPLYHIVHIRQTICRYPIYTYDKTSFGLHYAKSKRPNRVREKDRQSGITRTKERSSGKGNRKLSIVCVCVCVWMHTNTLPFASALYLIIIITPENINRSKYRQCLSYNAIRLAFVDGYVCNVYVLCTTFIVFYDCFTTSHKHTHTHPNVLRTMHLLERKTKKNQFKCYSFAIVCENGGENDFPLNLRSKLRWCTTYFVIPEPQLKIENFTDLIL